MNLEKYTERARGFIQSAQSLALREGHQQFTPEHLLKVLLDDDQHLISPREIPEKFHQCRQRRRQSPCFIVSRHDDRENRHATYNCNVPAKSLLLARMRRDSGHLERSGDASIH